MDKIAPIFTKLLIIYILLKKKTRTLNNKKFKHDLYFKSMFYSLFFNIY